MKNKQCNACGATATGPALKLISLSPEPKELKALRKWARELEALVDATARAHAALRHAEDRAQKLAEIGEKARHMLWNKPAALSLKKPKKVK